MFVYSLCNINISNCKREENNIDEGNPEKIDKW